MSLNAEVSPNLAIPMDRAWLLCPLGVVHQTKIGAARFGAQLSRNGCPPEPTTLRLRGNSSTTILVHRAVAPRDTLRQRVVVAATSARRKMPTVSSSGSTRLGRDVVLVDLALQGGGAHGAFTWGVLDRFLEEDRLQIEGISGTSAGAMNAAVLADGHAAGGREGAQAACVISGGACPMPRVSVRSGVARWT